MSQSYQIESKVSRVQMNKKLTFQAGLGSETGIERIEFNNQAPYRRQLGPDLVHDELILGKTFCKGFVDFHDRYWNLPFPGNGDTPPFLLRVRSVRSGRTLQSVILPDVEELCWNEDGKHSFRLSFVAAGSVRFFQHDVTGEHFQMGHSILPFTVCHLPVKLSQSRSNRYYYQAQYLVYPRGRDRVPMWIDCTGDLDYLGERQFAFREGGFRPRAGAPVAIYYAHVPEERG